MKILADALLVTALAFPALARDSTWDLRCLVTDAAGNKLIYHFGTALKDGKIPEVSFVKNEEKTGFPEGSEPTWTKSAGDNDPQFNSDAEPDLVLKLTELRTQADVLYANAELFKGGESVGAGYCSERLHPTTPAAPPPNPPPGAQPQPQGKEGSADLTRNRYGGMETKFSVGRFSYSAMVDTGNTFELAITRQVADELVRNGLASWTGMTAKAILANGSRTTAPLLLVSSVTIAGHSARNVDAVTDGSTMLIGLPLLNRLGGGKFSFSHGRLVFDAQD